MNGFVFWNLSTAFERVQQKFLKFARYSLTFDYLPHHDYFPILVHLRLDFSGDYKNAYLILFNNLLNDN